MDYKSFEKLYRTDPILFHLGMELFENVGRISMYSNTEAELRVDAVSIVDGYFQDYKLRRMIQAAKDFSSLSAVERIAYAARCGIKLEDGPIHKPGICPLCGGALRYGKCETTDKLRIQDWTCEKCGATGKEAHRMAFDCHYQVEGGKDQSAVK